MEVEVEDEPALEAEEMEEQRVPAWDGQIVSIPFLSVGGIGRS